MQNPIFDLNVRKRSRHGREPFSNIIGAIAGVLPGPDLRLIAPFEPVPLFNELAKQGFVRLDDRDPVPLHYQFSAEWPGAFAWEHLVKGPEEFRAKITKLLPTNKT